MGMAVTAGGNGRSSAGVLDLFAFLVLFVFLSFLSFSSVFDTGFLPSWVWGWL